MSTEEQPTTAEDIIDEAVRIVDEGERQGLPLRLVGGIAIHLRKAAGLPAEFTRSYADIDLVARRKDGRKAVRLLESLGYESNDRVNMMGDGSRLQVLDLVRDRQTDLFVGDFRMCHSIPLGDRLQVEPRTLPLAELLLTKLQIVDLNRKDALDICAVVFGHELGESDDTYINVTHLGRLLAADWGLWRTTVGTIDALPEMLETLDLPHFATDEVSERLNELRTNIDRTPKTMRWRSRARVGERKRWYERPEEVAR